MSHSMVHFDSEGRFLPGAPVEAEVVILANLLLDEVPVVRCELLAPPLPRTTAAGSPFRPVLRLP